MVNNKTKRPSKLCPCGNDVLVELCHGADNGVAVHTGMLCPCGKNKTYKKCCFKRRRFYRETLTTSIPPPTIIVDRAAIDCISMMKEMVKDKYLSEGKTMEEIKHMPLFPKDMLPQSTSTNSKSNINAIGGSMGQFNRDMFGEMADSNTNPMLDVCFKWCIRHPENDFICARPWRSGSIMRVSKYEGQKRRDEWNSWVDEYIYTHSKVGLGVGMKIDSRSPEEISKLNKVSWTGNAMLKKCENPGCQVEETRESEFKGCGNCSIVMYHDKSCQKAHWKKHKRECGQNHTEHFLPSQTAMLEIFGEIPGMQM